MYILYLSESKLTGIFNRLASAWWTTKDNLSGAKGFIDWWRQ
jgi:hypothetical protein